MIPGLLRPRPTGSVILPVFAAVLLACGGSDISAPNTPPTAARPNFITNGVPTGSDFGSVGALLLDIDGDGTIDGLDCSGSLIAPTVFLVAAHCVSSPGLNGDCGLPASQHYVTFVPDLLATFPPPDAIQAAECHAEQFNFRIISDVPDLGVLILPAGSTTGKTPYQLPPAGLLDQLAANGGLVGQLFVNVGYGFDATRRGRRGFSFDGVRRTSKSPFSALLPRLLVLLMNTNATGEGGVCYVDSGSPHFMDGNLDVAVAVTSWSADPRCRSINGNYRLDTPAARAFLGQFVQLP